ncbi:aminoglycoside phosphotransferase family protein [Longirhabdus pacifica]|uniref:aminoglycoside phosphotransferase family protein n=1 Tax=Longirhabdus pacifica TaxID=2305227 RepID=UPI001F0BF61E|nr:aminoglycoside phosphotransferase family protein [Longirhabdus pacifica]
MKHYTIDPSLLLASIPILKNSLDITPIHKGYSADQKYVITTTENHSKQKETQLLRTFAMEEMKHKQMEYEILEKMKELRIPCSKPIQIGSIPDLDIGYMLLSYVEGQDAAEALPYCSEKEQMQIGKEAGETLRLIHQVAAPPSLAPWYDRKIFKHQQYIEKYKACGVVIKKSEKILSFIEAHLPLMKGRPNLFQHDDFTVGNIIVKDKKFSGVIDFNRFDWGDPIHEFLKIGLFSRESSIPFCIGQINGYFNTKQPETLFWQLYSLYLAMSLISSVVWIIQVKPEELEQMMDRIYTILEDHQYFEQTKPLWYKHDLLL